MVSQLIPSRKTPREFNDRLPDRIPCALLLLTAHCTFLPSAPLCQPEIPTLPYTTPDTVFFLLPIAMDGLGDDQGFNVGDQGSSVKEPISQVIDKVFVDESDEVDFVMDSLASDTIVPDSEDVDGETFSDSDVDAANALVHLHSTKVSTFQSDREALKVSNLMHPVMFPGWYGSNDHVTNEAATDLLWISHGIAPRLSLLEFPEEPLDSEAFEVLKVAMLKIAYPYMYGRE